MRNKCKKEQTGSEVLREIKIINGNNTITGPKKIATSFNNYFNTLVHTTKPTNYGNI